VIDRGGDLDSLRFHWGAAYEIGYRLGQYRAVRRDDGSVVRHAELPVAPGVHLLPVQAALADQVPAHRAHGRSLQSDPACPPPVRKGEVADGPGRLHPGRVCTPASTKVIVRDSA